MLARTAERMYWFGRYMERAEATARLVAVNTNLVLDLPKVKHIWASLIDINGTTAEFNQRFTRADERNVVKFLLEDESGSIRAAIRRARENARTTREIIPTEAWERVNELHLYLRRNVDKGIKRDGRHRFLTDIINLCNQLTGLLAGNMSDDDEYNFIKIGRNLERADMTTRVVDVGCLNMANPDQGDITEYENILWMNVLRSLTGYQMYRQHVRDRVNSEDVVAFLLTNEKFPRAVVHCLADVHAHCEALPKNDAVIRAIAHAQRMITSQNVLDIFRDDKLHDFIDDIQLELAEIHTQVGQTWFGYTPRTSIPESAEIATASQSSG
ncbi:MAG TPA: alpha-E domain-containing protein [Pseudomonadales bacterium]|nr:alpha-E domain-containing protein [Pseudomonadales bacterium]